MEDLGALVTSLVGIVAEVLANVAPVGLGGLLHALQTEPPVLAILPKRIFAGIKGQPYLGSDASLILLGQGRTETGEGVAATAIDLAYCAEMMFKAPVSAAIALAANLASKYNRV